MDNIKVQKDKITVCVGVYVFINDGSYIAYCPSLDLSGYGQTEAEARGSLDFCLNEYFTYGMSNNVLDADLTKYGWKQKGEESTNCFQDLVKKNKNFAKMVDDNDFSKYSTLLSVSLPAV